MKKTYNNPGMEINMFETERLLTVSGAESADDKAAEALEIAGTTQNVTVRWTF